MKRTATIRDNSSLIVRHYTGGKCSDEYILLLIKHMRRHYKMIGTTNSHNLRTDITHNGGGQMCQQAKITVKERSNPIEKTVSMSSHISQGEGSTSTHLLC